LLTSNSGEAPRQYIRSIKLPRQNISQSLTGTYCAIIMHKQHNTWYSPWSFQVSKTNQMTVM